MDKLRLFAEALAEICAHALVAPGRPLRWVIIANPYAGGFVMHSRWEKGRRELEECRVAARVNPPRENSRPAETVFAAPDEFAVHGLVPTKGPDCAAEITNRLIYEITSVIENTGGDTAPHAAPFYLLITAGGDGTSLGALSALYHASAAVRSHVAVLRLPLGTGNDGADSPHLTQALDRLIKPSRVVLTPALRLIPAADGPAVKAAGQKAPFLAFNILSIGLDAFVTHMTNRMKGRLPGDFYKLWVDIAALLYDRLYTVGVLDVRALDDDGGVIRALREKILLLAVGASGHRTYGSQKKILPDTRNVCAIRQMSLLRKVALKDLFSSGTHIDKPESILFNAHRVEFSGEYPLLAQMDGETILLQREDFPAAIELTVPLIPGLKPAD